jgi:NADH-quinone oxidoreductase subunit L
MDTIAANQFQILAWIVLFPLIGAIINGIAGAKLPRRLVEWIGCGSIFLSFIASVAGIRALWANKTAVTDHGEVVHYEFGQLTYTWYEWIAAGDLSVDISFLLDPLSAVMIMVITGVGLLIHIYSIGYMENEEGVWRYFAFLNLFCFAMLMLVLGKNMLVAFIGWEGVGLCSYLLIGYWYEDDHNAEAGQKAFIVNRVGDFAFLAGLFLLFYEAQTFDFVALEQLATDPKSAAELYPIAIPAALLIFIGCTGKSAQIPLYNWLPDAMAGPTPVSALIHAATMVTAGVYLIARMNYLFSMHPAIGLTIATVGVLTAFFAATVAIVQNDIKKVLAFSTISQLGYMFTAVGMGAYAAGVFHLMTHAFFKALLFLGAGSVIHAMHHKQDIREMGGLREYMPITAGTFFVACCAIAGVPLFAGFFSKDLILWSAFSKGHLLSIAPESMQSMLGAEGATKLNYVTDTVAPVIKSGEAVEMATWASTLQTGIYVLGVITAGLTAFYMFRLYFLTFEGECRADDETKEHLHESPESMTAPLMALGILSVVGGWIGWPHFIVHIKSWLGAAGEGGHHALANWQSAMLGIETWLDEVFHHSESHRYLSVVGKHAYGMELVATVTSVIVAFGGIVAAWWAYLKKPGLPQEIADRFDGLYETVSNQYWVDHTYYRVFVDGTLKVAGFMYAFDKYIIDGLIVDGVGWAAEQAGNILKHLQGGNVQRYATYIVVALVLALLAIMYPG